jgi:hypothetical protein
MNSTAVRQAGDRLLSASNFYANIVSLKRGLWPGEWNSTMGDRDVRWLFITAGIVALLFGLLCLNYTKASGLERHRAFAQQHQLPEPSNGILLGGVVAVSFGSAIIGYSLGSRSRHSSRPAVSSPSSIESD